MGKWKKHILIVFFAVLLNLVGRFTALYLELPGYMNLLGTMLAAYLAGPVAGTLAAVLSCAVSSVISPGDWYYLAADIAVAVATGLLGRQNRFFEKSHLIISATTFFALARTPILLGVNLIRNGGRSGFVFADAIIDYLGSVQAASWLRYTVTAMYLSFTDVLAASVLLYLGMMIRRNFGKKKRAAQLRRQLGGTVTLGLAAALTAVSLAGPLRCQAADSLSFTEKLYTGENGLIGGCLNDIAMTRDGTMWVATYGGLFRFNGSDFILIDDLKSVRSVATLFVDEEDRLWAGTQDAGVTLLNIDMSSCTLNADNGLPSNSVKCISRDSNGFYYFGTTAGIVVAEYADGEIRVIRTDTAAGNIKDLTPDQNGRMIVMNNLGEVRCFEGGVAIAQLSLTNATPTGVRYDPEGNLYIGTDSGRVLIYTFSAGRFHTKGTIEAGELRSIADVYPDENGMLYIAAENGIGYSDPDGHMTMIEGGEFNNSVEHIFRDYQGNLWFTSSRCGLLCLARSSFTDIFKLCGESNIVCNAVREWGGYLCVGTNDGIRLLDMAHGESVKNGITRMLGGVRIRSMEMDRSGNLLVATYDKGLMEITQDGRVMPYVNTETTGKRIRVVSILSDGTVITAGDAGMVFLRDHEVTGKLVPGEDLGGASVLNILEREDHVLLCGTDSDGIAMVKDGKLLRYLTAADGLSSGVILRIVRDPRGDGFFVLTGSGLCYLHPDDTITELGMPYYNNFDLTVNKFGEVFVLGGAGIYVGDYQSLMKEEQMESFLLLDSRNGLPGSITSNAWNYVTEEEKIYLCGSGGVYMLDLDNYEMEVEDYKTKITAIRRDGVFEDVTQFGRIEIPRGVRRIEFDLEINNYTTADPRVSYYLSGVDTEKTIVRSSQLGTVSYQDLPSGDHEFIIEVLNDKGKELASQTYLFSKEKELYETTGFLLYFYLLLFTFIAFLVTSIVQGALWSQRKREEGRHEQVVTQLEREKEEALQRALYLEEDANRTKSEFMASMSHEIRTPINAILGMDTMILRESGEEGIREYARDIRNAGKKLLTVVNELFDGPAEGEGDTLRDAGEEESAPAEGERFHAPDARILVVDDVRMNLTVVRNLLKRTRVQVDTAQSGEEAVASAREIPYDLILLDSRMPGMNGDETMHHLRKNCPLHAETPIIVMTSDAGQGAREEYLDLGYTNYLPKPIDGDRLEAMLQNYLPEEKLRPVTEAAASGEEAPGATDTDRQAEAAMPGTGDPGRKAAGSPSSGAGASADIGTASSGEGPSRTAAAGSSGAREGAVLYRIGEIRGIDRKMGIEIAGGVGAYLVFCRHFHETIRMDAERIRDLLAKGDMDSCIIELPALANSLRLIGATALSEEALRLSLAGREEGADRIRKEIPGILDRCSELDERMGSIFASGSGV